MRKLLNPWAGFALLLVVALIGITYFAIRAGRPIVETTTVAEGEIATFVDERGKTRLPTIYDLTLPFAGQIEPIEVDVGERVSAGQVVARLSPTDLQNEVDQTRAVVRRLEAEIAQNDDTRLEDTLYTLLLKFVESLEFTLQAADARRKASQARLDYSETVLGRFAQLLKEDATSQERYDTVQLNFNEAQQGFAQDNFVYSAVNAIEAAMKFLPRMVQTYIDKKQLSRAVLEKQLNEAQAVLDQAEVRQARGDLKSPVNGVVLDREYQTQQFLNAGTRLLSVGDLEQLQVEAELLTQEAVEIAAGARVEVYGPATGRALGEGYPGKVLRIDPQGFSKLSSLGVEQQRVRVIIGLDEPARQALLAKGVGVDYRVRVRVFSEEKSATSIIPRTALFRGPQGEWQVFTVQGQRVRLRTLKVGLLNDRYAEVLEGVEEGDNVVLAPPANLKPGTAVRVLTGD